LTMKPYHQTKTNKIYVGDCLKVMPDLKREFYDLVFADPPFNIGYEYDQYEDNRTADDYLSWCDRWLTEIDKCLKTTGTVWIAIGPKYQAELKILMDRRGWTWRNTIIWHYTFGAAQKNNFTPSHTVLHYYTKSKNKWYFDADSIRVPSQRQLRYNDRRANRQGKLPDNVWVLVPSDHADTVFRPEGTVHLSSRVAGTFNERTGHPCQMPESIVERVVKATSSEEAYVLDPFLGSGTTMRVCKKLGRQCTGIELSEDYARIAVQSLRGK
jgi:DNA modification methylase